MEIMVFMSIVSIAAVILSIIMTVKFFQATTDIKKIRESVCVEKNEVVVEKRENQNENLEDKISHPSTFSEGEKFGATLMIFLSVVFVVLFIIFFAIFSHKDKHSETSDTIEEKLEKLRKEVSYSFGYSEYDKTHRDSLHTEVYHLIRNLQECSYKSKNKEDLKMFLTEKTIDKLGLDRCDSIIKNDYFKKENKLFSSDYVDYTSLFDIEYDKTAIIDVSDGCTYCFKMFCITENDTLKMSLISEEIENIKLQVEKDNRIRQEKKNKEWEEQKKMEQEKKEKMQNGY